MTDLPPPFDALWFQMMIGLVVGLALGSFATMLSYRLPRGISTVTPRSHCPACRTTLSPRELVPVFSWVVQGGTCRTCGVFTGWRYPLIELAVGLLTMFAFALWGFTLFLFLPVSIIVIAVTFLSIKLEQCR